MVGLSGLGSRAALVAAAALTLAAVAQATPAAAAGPTGNLVDPTYARLTLPLLPGFSSGTVRAINDAGVAAGSQVRESTGKSKPVLWGPRRVPRTLPLPPGSRSGLAADVNNRGVVVGSAVRTSDGRSYAVRWVDGRPRWLTVPPRNPEVDRDYSSEATAVNDKGMTVGYACVDRCLAAAWRPDGRQRTFNSPAGASAEDVNESGVAVGTYSAAGADAFVWFLRSSPAPYTLRRYPDTVVSTAQGVNDAGTVVGTMSVEFDATYAVTWVDGEPVALPNASQDSAGAPFSINNRGIIVGGSGFPSEAPVIWRDGRVFDLPRPTNTSGEAVDINATGKVVGTVGGAPTLWRPKAPTPGT